MNSTKINGFIVPLGREAHRLAEQFAAQQATPQQGKRVYLNTLAVYAVHRYLKYLQIESNLEQSDSWHLVGQVIDVADLVLPGIGKLECRPLLPGETAFDLSLDVQENLIGYVAVQFSDILTDVEILGFLPATAVALDKPPEQIQISRLQSLETLIDHIYDATEVLADVPLQEVFVRHKETLVNLSQWFQNFCEPGWQMIDELLSPNQMRLAFNKPRSSSSREIYPEKNKAVVGRAKSIDLGMELVGHGVTLVVVLTPETNEQTGVHLRVFPSGNQTYLPVNIQLAVLDDSGKRVLEATSRTLDNWIQLQFTGEIGEEFSVRVGLGNACITENFVI